MENGVRRDAMDDKLPVATKRNVASQRQPVYTRPGWLRRLRLRFSFRMERLAARFVLLLEEEHNRGGAFLWTPVLFGLGILLYFGLPREPLALAFPTLAIIAAALAWRSSRTGLWYRGAVVSALVAAGVSTAQLHVWIKSTAMLANSVVATVDARIERIERRANGSARYTLRLDKGSTSLGARGLERTPERVRLTARKALPDARIGDRLQGKARVGPPPAAVMPGGYDFAFHAWFAGIGGSGFFLGQPQLVVAESHPFSLNTIRSAIARIIYTALPAEPGAVAVALIVGDRSGIPEPVSEALRRSGLAHILAISGLHMTLVAGTVLVATRLGFALIPGMALQYPVKKWAAAAALVAATLYLGISGGGVSARRAYIMVSIMLLAVLADRRALTMRNVSLAALVVLVLAPQAILAPGFQMSFAAVAALVAMFEIARALRRTGSGQDRMHSWVRAVAQNLGGLAMTSLVAGVATGIFAAYHFHRIAPLGLPANLVAMPIVSFVVMPMALLSVLTMPFGLEQWPLQMMGLGSGAVVTIAEWFANTGPTGATGRIPLPVLAFITGALLVATLARTRLRMFALVPIVLSVALPLSDPKPDILISGTGRQVALLRDDGIVTVLRPRAEKFTTKIWKAAYGEGSEPDERFVCDPFGCAATVRGKVVVAVKNTDRLWDDCRMADILVLPFAAPNACNTLAANERPYIVDATTLNRHGAHSLHIRESGEIYAETARPQVNRPWNDLWAGGRPANR